jgi:hypothetical protein
VPASDVAVQFVDCPHHYHYYHRRLTVDGYGGNPIAVFIIPIKLKGYS